MVDTCKLWTVIKHSIFRDFAQYWIYKTSRVVLQLWYSIERHMQAQVCTHTHTHVRHLSAGESGSMNRMQAGADSASVANTPPWSCRPKPVSGSPLSTTSLFSTCTTWPPTPTVLERDTEDAESAERESRRNQMRPKRDQNDGRERPSRKMKTGQREINRATSEQIRQEQRKTINQINPEFIKIRERHQLETTNTRDTQEREQTRDTRDTRNSIRQERYQTKENIQHQKEN